MGPTCIGKSLIVLDLCKEFLMDFISVDASSIYKSMDIGTAKPGKKILCNVNYHLIDILDPKEKYSVGKFYFDSIKIVDNSINNGRLPCFVGGTMMYFWVLKHGLNFFDKGNNNVIDNFKEFDIVSIIIVPFDKFDLLKNIELRLNNMFMYGFIDEVNNLYKRGDLNFNMQSIKSIGYRQIWDYLSGNTSLYYAKKNIVTVTKTLVKRQLTWLKRWNNNAYVFFNNDKTLLTKIKYILLNI